MTLQSARGARGWRVGLGMWLGLMTLVACKASAPAAQSVARKALTDSTVVAPTAIAGVIPAASTELVTAILPAWDSSTATMRRYHRIPGGPWLADGDAWAAVPGSGAAWGAGLHGDGPPTGHSGGTKREGDGRSPAGAFALTASYGYAGSPPEDATPGLPYAPLTPATDCVDDSAHAAYNTIVTGPTDARSFEVMRRPDELYRWVVFVDHNPHHTPGAGSCIFLHVWSDAATPTVGCTAMPEPTIRALLAWLRADAHPTFVLLPRAEYVALAPVWGLPADAEAQHAAEAQHDDRPR